MPRVLVIGFGNPLRTDDAVGFRAAEVLAGSLAANPGVEVLPCAELFPELAETIAGASHVIFIDAANRGEAGKIVCREIVASEQSLAFTHDCQPASLLAAGTALYGRCPRTWIVTVTGASFNLGMSLTSRVEAALPSVVEHVRQLIHDCLDGRDSKLSAAPHHPECILQVQP